MLTVGGLFSGIGGIELGLERAGMRVVWHCEQDPYARAVLERHWPGIPCYEDVRDLAGADVAPVDVLCGGFPCQDISSAGYKAGIDGTRSGLWSEYARLVGELRPRYVVVENVAALLARGFERVLGDLAALGYDAEWDCIPASAVGAPHQRDRLWIVGYPHNEGEPDEPVNAQAPRLPAVVADPDPERRDGRSRDQWSRWWGESAHGSGNGGNPWAVEPDVGRVAHGVPARMDRLRALGNAVVPPIPEWIGRRIVEWEGGIA